MKLQIQVMFVLKAESEAAVRGQRHNPDTSALPQRKFRLNWSLSSCSFAVTCLVFNPLEVCGVLLCSCGVSVSPGVRSESLHCLRAEQRPAPPAEGQHLRGGVPVHAAHLPPQQVRPAASAAAALGRAHPKKKKIENLH